MFLCSDLHAGALNVKGVADALEEILVHSQRKHKHMHIVMHEDFQMFITPQKITVSTQVIFFRYTSAYGLRHVLMVP